MIPRDKLKDLKTAIVKLKQEREFCEIMDRGVVLMEAGLKERPLDRDLYLLIKTKFEMRKQEVSTNLDIANMILELVEKHGSNL